MRVAVVQFPGSNCDQDCVLAVNSFPGASAFLLWHQSTSLENCSAVILPGGFSYGDYLRCGAIARFSPVMSAVAEAARAGLPVLGICNGFQILCEAKLLPGALIRNRGLHFLCQHVFVRTEASSAAAPHPHLAPGTILRIPIAHGEGCYYADEPTLASLEANRQILLRYCTSSGALDPAANPNGSTAHIAGITNPQGNIWGMMPHPERACDPLLGSTDGRLILAAFLENAKKFQTHNSPKNQPPSPTRKTAS